MNENLKGMWNIIPSKTTDNIEALSENVGDKVGDMTECIKAVSVKALEHTQELSEGITEKARETAEKAHNSVCNFDEKYISKIRPDFGKYGDLANFALELLPGVDEYNAIKDGDWQKFAIAAGIDIATIAIGAVTLGAGSAAIKGGKLAAKTAVKKATKEVGEKVTKETAERAVKEATEKIVKETLEKTIKESPEKVAKEVGTKIDKSLIPNYIKEVESITNREIPTSQLKQFTKMVKEQDFAKLSPEKIKLNKRLFNSARGNLIEEWQIKTGQTWPKYTEDVLNDAGEVIRKKGQAFDAHHLIELSYGGPNIWWNLHPAAFPKEHQAGIHGVNRLASKIF